jgi:hypothetical protein
MIRVVDDDDELNDGTYMKNLAISHPVINNIA